SEPPWVGLPNVSTLTVGRLDPLNVENMIARVTGGRPLPTEVTEEIVVKTDGNPLFVEELTKAVLEAGILVEDGEGYRLHGPLPRHSGDAPRLADGASRSGRMPPPSSCST